MCTYQVHSVGSPTPQIQISRSNGGGEATITEANIPASSVCILCSMSRDAILIKRATGASGSAIIFHEWQSEALYVNHYLNVYEF